MKRVIATFLMMFLFASCGGDSKSDNKPVKGDKKEQKEENADDESDDDTGTNDTPADDDDDADDESDDQSDGGTVTLSDGTEVNGEAITERAQEIMNDPELLAEFEAEHELTERETKVMALFWLMIMYSEEEPDMVARLAAMGIIEEVQDIALEHPESLEIEMAIPLSFQMSGTPQYTCGSNCAAQFKETIRDNVIDITSLLVDIDKKTAAAEATWGVVKAFITGNSIADMVRKGVDGFDLKDAASVVGFVADVVGNVELVAYTIVFKMSYGYTEKVYACVQWKERNCEEFFCHNDVTDPGEKCDDECIEEYDCVIRENKCEIGEYSGSPADCSAECKVTVKRFCLDDDGCCPSECDSSSDSDCIESDLGELGGGDCDSGCDPGLECLDGTCQPCGGDTQPCCLDGAPGTAEEDDTGTLQESLCYSGFTCELDEEGAGTCVALDCDTDGDDTYDRKCREGERCGLGGCGKNTCLDARTTKLCAHEDYEWWCMPEHDCTYYDADIDYVHIGCFIGSEQYPTGGYTKSPDRVCE